MKNLVILLILYTSLSFSQIAEGDLPEYLEKERLELEIETLANSNYYKAYRIWTGIQVLEFYSLSNGEHFGYLTNYVQKSTRRKNEMIFNKVKISKNTTCLIMGELEKQNIEKLKDYKQIPNYLNGVDGQLYTFEVNIEGNSRVYSYWEPEAMFQNSGIVEIKNVRNILRSINSRLHLEKSFETFKNSLPNGTYHYGMVTMQKVSN